MNPPQQTILIVDDEKQIRRLLQIGLEAQGFAVIEATTIQEGIARCADAHPDLVILDMCLPDANGLDLIVEVRSWSSVPILLLSVRSSEGDKVAALDLGGNDYVTKPFSMAELLARVRALLRNRAHAEIDSGIYRVGELELDVATHRVTQRGKPLVLTRTEFRLLQHLMMYAGRVLTHKQLLREIWGEAHENDTQYLRVYVARLREKLDDDPSQPRFISNEIGIGYRFIHAER